MSSNLWGLHHNLMCFRLMFVWSYKYAYIKIMKRNHPEDWSFQNTSSCVIFKEDHWKLLQIHISCLAYSIHYNDVIIGVLASQITSLTIVYLNVYSGGDQRKHQSSASLAFVRGFHRSPVNSPHKWPVTRKMFPGGHLKTGGKLLQ